MNRLIKHMKYFLVLVIFSTFNHVLAYTMPVGVPDTSIDFTQDAPARPDSWLTEVQTETAGYYYIDQTNGSNTNTYGTPDAPRASLPSFTAGRYIEIKGEYSFTNNTVLSITGTNADWVAETSGPVWLVSADEGQAYITTKKVFFIGENLFVSDIIFNDGGQFQLGSGNAAYSASSNIVIRNCELDMGNVANTGVIVINITNSIIYNCNIHDMGTPNILGIEAEGIVGAVADEDSHVISVGQDVYHLWILDNELHDASGSGVSMISSNNINGVPLLTNVYVARNEIYGTRQAGVALKYGSDVVFSSNHIHDIYARSGSPAKGMMAQYYPNGLWMINNNVHDVEYGIRYKDDYSSSGSNLYVIGNVFHDIRSELDSYVIGGDDSWQYTAINLLGGYDVYIYNNLIFNAPNGISGAASLNSLNIKNNLIFDLTNGQDAGDYGKAIWMDSVLGTEGLIKNNHFDSEFLLDLHTNYTTIAALTTAGATGNISAAPFLTNAEFESIMDNRSTGTYDFTSVTDMGTDVSDIIKTEYFNTFGVEINLDILGMDRTQGNSIDIGPFEPSGTEASSTIPVAPKNLEISN